MVFAPEKYALPACHCKARAGRHFTPVEHPEGARFNGTGRSYGTSVINLRLTVGSDFRAILLIDISVYRLSDPAGGSAIP